MDITEDHFMADIDTLVGGGEFIVLIGADTLITILFFGKTISSH